MPRALGAPKGDSVAGDAVADTTPDPAGSPRAAHAQLGKRTDPEGQPSEDTSALESLSEAAALRAPMPAGPAKTRAKPRKASTTDRPPVPKTSIWYRYETAVEPSVPVTSAPETGAGASDAGGVSSAPEGEPHAGA